MKKDIMFQKQLKKHGNVMFWWANNTEKGVWSKLTTNKWHIILEPSFSLEYKYVQNDEYAEFRKALVDGKNVQYYVDGFTGWQYTNNFNNPMSGPENYRIQPSTTPKNYVNYDRIEKLSNMDNTVNFSSKVLKLSEEAGEVAQATLKYIGSKNVSKSADVKDPKMLVLEELCDTINVAVDIINALDVTEDEVIQMFEKKLDKWESKLKGL